MKNYIFGRWKLISSANRIDSASISRQLTKQQSVLLLALLMAPENTLTKEQLLVKVWQNKVVSDDAITRAISDLRKQLRLQDDDTIYIRTLHGIGYKLDVNISTYRTSPVKNKGVLVFVSGLIILSLSWYLIQSGTNLKPLQNWPVVLKTKMKDLPAEENHIVNHPDGPLVYFKVINDEVRIYSRQHNNTRLLFKTTAKILKPTISPDGQRLGFIHVGSDCSVISILLSKGDVSTLGNCIARSLVSSVLNWNGAEEIVIAERNQNGNLTRVTFHLNKRSKVQPLTSDTCQSLKHLFVSNQGEFYYSCKTERGDSLYKENSGRLEEIFSYRSIEKFVVDDKGLIYMMHAASYKTGITRFNPQDESYAFANTGWPSDIGLFDRHLVLVRDLRNLDVIGMNLTDLTPFEVETTLAKTLAIATDPQTGHLWQINDKGGRYRVYKEQIPQFAESYFSLDLANVVDMALFEKYNWMLLTTQEGSQYWHHWLDIENVPTIIKQVKASSPKVLIENDLVYFTSAAGKLALFDINSGNISEAITSQDEKVNVKERLTEISKECGSINQKARQTNIFVTENANKVSFTELTQRENEVLREWQDPRIDKLCAIRKVQFDSKSNRLYYLVERNRYRDVSYLRL